jgi:hypothetical protein
MRYRAYRRDARAAPDGSPISGLPTWAAVTIAVAGIAATLIGSLVAAKISGHEQRIQQQQALAAQAADSDRKELPQVIDEAAVAVLRGQRDLEAAATDLEVQRELGIADHSVERAVRAFHDTRLKAVDRSEARLLREQRARTQRSAARERKARGD